MNDKMYSAKELKDNFGELDAGIIGNFELKLVYLEDSILTNTPSEDTTFLKELTAKEEDLEKVLGTATHFKDFLKKFGEIIKEFKIYTGLSLDLEKIAFGKHKIIMNHFMLNESYAPLSCSCAPFFKVISDIKLKGRENSYYNTLFLFGTYYFDKSFQYKEHLIE